MTEPAGRVFAAIAGQDLLVRVVGRGTSHNSPALRQTAEEKLAGGTGCLRIYLAECTHIDSTFVGTLLSLARRPDLKQIGLQLCAPSLECRRVLKQMAVLSLFEVLDCDSDPPQADWQEVSPYSGGDNTWAFKRNVVEAHEQLASVPGPLADCFRAIAESCREELEAAQSRNEDH